MTGRIECVSENDSIVEATKKLTQINFAAPSSCGEDERLKGMVTERDIVARLIALGQDPAQTRAAHGYGKSVTVGANDTLQDALKTTTDRNVKRLPMIDGRQLVGHERGSLGHEWRRGSKSCRCLQQLRLRGRLLV